MLLKNWNNILLSQLCNFSATPYGWSTASYITILAFFKLFRLELNFFNLLKALLAFSYASFARYVTHPKYRKGPTWPFWSDLANRDTFLCYLIQDNTVSDLFSDMRFRSLLLVLIFSSLPCLLSLFWIHPYFILQYI